MGSNPAIAAALLVGVLLAALPGVGRCHIDATRVSLSQLFLQADVVLLARIQGAGDREVSRGEGSAVTELVSATVIETFKGEAGEQVSVFLDAHGPAHYSPGDTAVLFLEEPWAEHPLADAVAAGEIDFFSRQVRTTEHRVNPENEADYRWVLGHYAAHWQRHQACVVDGSASADVFGSGSGTSAASLEPEPVPPVALSAGLDAETRSAAGAGAALATSGAIGASVGADGACSAAACWSPLIVTSNDPSSTEDPTSTWTAAMVPACPAGISIDALSDSTTTSRSSTVTSSPTATATSMTSTS